MIAAIDGIARNPDELKRLGTTARQFVGEHYTLERSIRRYDSVLSELLAAGGA
jgi:glycosyltransferase involved in cell wall biosynthesis